MGKVNIGELAKAHYRSGTYIGKVKEDRGDMYLIEVLAVHKHPLQGDLHNMYETENVFFHERKALAFREKMNVKKPAVHPFDGKVPDYAASLEQAITDYRQKLNEEDSAYNRLALQTLDRLAKEVYAKIGKGS